MSTLDFKEQSPDSEKGCCERATGNESAEQGDSHLDWFERCSTLSDINWALRRLLHLVLSSRFLRCDQSKVWRDSVSSLWVVNWRCPDWGCVDLLKNPFVRQDAQLFRFAITQSADLTTATSFSECMRHFFRSSRTLDSEEGREKSFHIDEPSQERAALLESVWPQAESLKIASQPPRSGALKQFPSKVLHSQDCTVDVSGEKIHQKSKL